MAAISELGYKKAKLTETKAAQEAYEKQKEEKKPAAVKVDPEKAKEVAKKAIKKIDDSTYGYCEETAEPIGLKRLIARPIATLSIEAQEKHEKNEKIFADL